MSTLNSFYYKNGNYIVYTDILDKTYRLINSKDTEFKPDFPDSIDLKITNKCNLGCPYCHELSNPNGKSFDLEKTKEILSGLPFTGIEIAIGGGDILCCINDTVKLIEWCNEKFEVRTTVNSKTLNTDEYKILSDSIRTVGISVDPNIKDIVSFCSSLEYINHEYVFHLIVGINPVEQIKELLKNEYYYNRCLILGFKHFGRGKTYNIKESEIKEWSRELKEFLFCNRHLLFGKIIGFDNLAIEQLEIKDFILENDWENSYIGSEFSHSMYIDAVSQTFAPTSTSTFRMSWDDINLLDFFKKYKNKWENS